MAAMSNEPKTEIDWGNVRTLDDLEMIVGERLYDNADNTPDVVENEIEMRDDLTPYEIADAKRWSRFSRGVMLITGIPGAGKTSLMNILAWKFRRYYGKTVILDSKPRQLFGPYIPYSSLFLYEMCERLRLYTDVMSQTLDSTRHWYTERGEIFIRNAVIGLDEIKRYLPRETPGYSISQLWLSLFTVWRHLNSLIIGCCTKKEDVTSHCYPEITTEVRCVAIADAPGMFKAVIYPLRFNTGTMVFNVVGKPIAVVTNILEPIPPERHPPLAGYRWCDIYNSWNAQSVRVPLAFERRLMRERERMKSQQK